MRVASSVLEESHYCGHICMVPRVMGAIMGRCSLNHLAISADSLEAFGLSTVRLRSLDRGKSSIPLHPTQIKFEGMHDCR